MSDNSDAAIERVIGNFVKGLPDRIQAISAAYAAEDWSGMRMLSHRLAGAAIFGFPELGAAAHRVENAIDNGDTGTITPLFQQLQEISEQVQNAKFPSN